MIKSRRMRQAGNVVRMRTMRHVYKFWLEILKGNDHSEALGVDGKIILKLILEK
jgi:hypothetical protein